MTNVTVLGLGHMGAPLARRLARLGHTVTVWNRTAARAARIEGVAVAASPAEASATADVVITMLTDGSAVLDVVAAARLRPGVTLVEMSTIGPDALRELTARVPAGVDVVDAPVAGSVEAATSGTLRILAGGDPEAINRVEPVLSGLGDVRRCGGPGSGAAMKLVLNTALVTALTSLSDALSVADALGVDRGAALDALRTGPLGIAVQRAVGGAGQFALTLAAKDLDLALKTAGSLPVADAARARLRKEIAAGNGALDLSSLI